MHEANVLFAKSGISSVTASKRTYPKNAVHTFSLCQLTLRVPSKGEHRGKTSSREAPSAAHV